MNSGIKKVLIENLVNGNTVTKEGAVKMSPGSLLDVALYIAENLLPKIEFKSGQQSHDYKQMFMAVNACLLCCELMQENDRLKNLLHIKMQLLKYTQQENRKLEEELVKFTTIQELMKGESLEMYIDIVNGKKIAELSEIIKQYQARNKH